MHSYLIVGGIFGFFSAILGGIVDSQIFSKRHTRNSELSLGGPMLILAGIINSVVGVIAIVVSLLVTGSLSSAFWLGLSVLIGFILGFLLLASLSIFRDK